MRIERTIGNQIQITLPDNLDSRVLQRILDYLLYLEIVSKSNASQKDADALANELNDEWWSKNKGRFIK
jgi:hypothetical protein